MAPKKEASAASCLPNFDETQLHLRAVVENLLNNPPQFPPIDPETLPIAGLKSFEYQGNLIYPQEILPFSVQPMIIIDLDDTVWPQVENLVKAFCKATCVPITMEYFRSIGHTRKIPEWDTPEINALMDLIEQGAHPDYLPHVCLASPEAISTIKALQQMGHHFSYLTSRQPELFDITCKTLALNQLPLNPQSEPVDARLHLYPQPQYLYCAPSNLPSGTQYKNEVVTQWLNHLIDNHWQGKMIVIDDLLKAFQEHIDSGKIIGISLAGPLNDHTQPYDKELRLNSWEQISQIIMSIH